jgi:hypothetical protein
MVSIFNSLEILGHMVLKNEKFGLFILTVRLLGSIEHNRPAIGWWNGRKEKSELGAVQAAFESHCATVSFVAWTLGANAGFNDPVDQES